MPVTGRYFYAASGRYFHAVLRRYFYAASGRPGRRCFPARFGAAKRQNGETAKRPRRCAARKQGARAAGRGDILMPFRGGIFMPVSRRYFHARFAAVFSCPFRGGIFMPVSGRYFHAVLRRYFHAVSGRYFHAASGRYFYAASGRRNGKTAAAGRCPQARGAGGRERGHDFSRDEDRSQTRARAAGEEMFSCPFRGGETAKRRNGRAGVPPASKGRGRPGEGA